MFAVKKNEQHNRNFLQFMKFSVSTAADLFPPMCETILKDKRCKTELWFQDKIYYLFCLPPFLPVLDILRPTIFILCVLRLRMLHLTVNLFYDPTNHIPVSNKPHPIICQTLTNRPTRHISASNQPYSIKPPTISNYPSNLIL